MSSDLWSIQQTTSFRILAESAMLRLGHFHEEGYLFHLKSHQVTELGWFYGDPSCGIVDKDSKWAIIAGTDLSVLWKDGTITELPFKNIHDIRQTDSVTVQILTDPWTPTSAIYT